VDIKIIVTIYMMTHCVKILEDWSTILATFLSNFYFFPRFSRVKKISAFLRF